MSNIEINNPITTIPDGYTLPAFQASNGFEILYSDFKLQERLNVNNDFFTNRLILRSNDDFDNNFSVNMAGEYVIPNGTAIEQINPFITLNRPFRLEGGISFQGYRNAPPTILSCNFNDYVFKGTGGNYIDLRDCIISAASLFLPVPTPNPNLNLVSLENPTITPNIFCLLSYCVFQGFGNLGSLSGYDFTYLNSVISQFNGESFKFKNSNELSLISYKWSDGISNGTCVTIEDVKNFTVVNQIFDVNPFEFAYNITDPGGVLEQGKIVSGSFVGTAAQSFKAGSLDQTEPKLIFDNVTPIPSSGYFVHVRAAGAVETITTANDFYPILSQISIVDNNSERFEVVGVGTNTRLYYRGKEDINIRVEFNASMKVASGSPTCSLGVAKNLGDGVILTTDTANYNLIDQTTLPSDATVLNGHSTVAIIRMSQDDYLKFYKRSTTTNSLTTNGMIGTVMKV